ncbi:MAG: DUF423 domain-containing protein [Alphaproteobacteria bacterium]|nr:DUF423 domain-containing protein [Alphaproteobacteria bacterium]
MTTAQRVTLLLAGLIGAAGVMAAAGASHGGESRNLSAIASVCLAHGPALLALALMAHGALLTRAGLLLAIGTAIFAADLGVREALGHGLFPLAAPIGGGAMIIAWLLLAFAAIVAGRHKSGSF